MRWFDRRMVTALLLMIGFGVPSAQGGLPAQIDRVLQWHELPRDGVSIWVQRVGDPEPSLTLNADTPRNPASVMKLFTTYAALDILGPAYRWRTEVHVEQEPVDGRVESLWLRGFGDPFLLQEDLWRIAGGVRRAGITRIDGPLILDTSHFSVDSEDPGAFDDAPWRVYNQPPHALLVNFNAIRFHLRPEPETGEVAVVPDPPLPGLDLTEQVRLRDGPCLGFQRGVSYHVDTERRVTVEGAYPRDCRDRFHLVRRALEPEDYLHGLFTRVWEQWDGEFTGGWRLGTWQTADTEPLYVHESQPLGNVIRLVNKYSSNVMARHLKLTIGAEVFDPPATVQKGNRAILDLLERHGIAEPGALHLENAAGLSRSNRVTVRQVARLLELARQAPLMPEFVSSLSLAGLDGTARRRFSGEPAAGRMHMKTGRLNNVSSIAGYVRAEDGHDYLVAVLVNAEMAHRGPGEALQDAVLSWVFGGVPP